jgi:hypothetical protein
MIFHLIGILLHICNVGEYFNDELNNNFVVVKKKLKKNTKSLSQKNIWVLI